MKNQNLAIVVDHDYQSGDIVSPTELIASADLVRRILENSITCKQIGPCIFSFSAKQKEEAFKAINNLEERMNGLRIKASFAKIESLDEEFNYWQEKCW
jgi:hypothetical protein